MSQIRPLGCIIAGIFTIITGIILLFYGIIIAGETRYLYHHWTQIYGLSIYSSVISILVIIGALGLIYVVNRQFPALTTLFSFTLIFLAFFAIICITILITGRIDLQRKTYDKTEQLIGNYSNLNKNENTKLIVDYIQQFYQCCGINRAVDWKNRMNDHDSTPDSCCKQMIAGCGKHSLIDSVNIYSNGCVEKLYKNFYRKYAILIGINISLIIVALLSALLGIIFERNIRQQYQSM